MSAQRRCTAASKMAQRGFRVFPVIPNSKVPFVSERSSEFAKLNPAEQEWSRKHPSLCGGIHLATRSVEAVKSWFEQCPDMNYGVSGSGLCILDVDIKNGKNGLDELKALGRLPATLRVRTPSGGLHVYFISENTGNRDIRPSINVRSHNGYVVGPGSSIDGRLYRVLSDRLPVPLPESLRFELAKAPTRDVNASDAIVALDSEGAIAAAIGFLVNEPPAESGERNMTAFRIACQLKDIGLSPQMIKEVMVEHWLSKLDDITDFGETEIETVAYNAFKSGRHAPGSSNPEVEFGDIVRDLPEVFKAALNRQSPTFISRCFADIERKPIEWLWRDRVALGKLTQLAGLPKLGKSQLTSYMAAAVSNGSAWPDGGTAPQGSVVLICGEDDPEDTIGPRLDAAGADVRRVHILDWAVGEGGKRQSFHVPNNIPALRDLIRSIGDVKLVVIDPLPAYMGGSDTHKTGEVRSAMLPLQALAAEENVAVVLLNHLNKNSKERSAINRVGGSGAFVAVCRSNWLVAADPDDDAQGDRDRRRLVMSLGSNIGRDRGGLAFHIESVTSAAGIETSRIRFEKDAISTSADDVLNVVSDGSGGAIIEAEAFLRRELAGGEAPSKMVTVNAMQNGIAPATLSRAKKRLGVTAQKRGKDWWMFLPPREVPSAAEEFADVFG